MDNRHQCTMTDRVPLSTAIYKPSLLPENGFMYELQSSRSFNTLIADRYQIIETLKNDGCLELLWAEDISCQEKCLIKQLVKQESLTPSVLHRPKSLRSAKRRLSREAEILYKVNHYPYIPQILACFKENQDYYLVQEFIEGHPLSEELPIGKRSGRFTEHQCLKMLEEILEILEFVHQNQVIHCNLNPENFIRRATDDRLVLINFGAVQPLRPTRDRQKISMTVPIGIFGYLAPEQLTSYPQANSDLYSLGLIAIQGLTGLHPGLLQVDVSKGKIRWQEELLVPVSKELVMILERMIVIQSQKRYESATEVKQAIASLLRVDGQPLTIDNTDFCATEEPTPDVDNTNAIAHGILDLVRPTDSTEKPDECLEPLDICAKADDSSDRPRDFDRVETHLDNSVQQTRSDLSSDRSEENIALPRKNGSYRFLLIFMILSIIINTLAGCVGLFHLFQIVPSDLGIATFSQAQELYQAGNLSQAIALAKSVRWDSLVYQDAQSALDKWQIESEKAAAQFQLIETAFHESRWLDVLSHAGDMPPISYWQDQISPLVNRAAIQVAPEAQTFLETAYTRALEKDFLGAIEQLKQIPYGTPAYKTAKAKIAEYQEKQGIKLETQAYQLLKQAYERAGVRDFAGALTFLEQIPDGTPTHARIHAKISEYRTKQQIKANALLQQAYDRAGANDYKAAIHLLKQIPSQTPAYDVAQGKIVEYRVRSRARVTRKMRNQASAAPSYQSYQTAYQLDMLNTYSFNPGEYLQEVNI